MLLAICAACGGATTTTNDGRDAPLLDELVDAPARDGPKKRTHVLDDHLYVATSGEGLLRRELGLEIPAYCGDYRDRLLTGWCVYRHPDRSEVGRAWPFDNANPAWVCDGYGDPPGTVTAFALCRRTP